MSDEKIRELLLQQAKEIRQIKLHLEALKRMMFEHRPPFVPAFEHQLGAVEGSGALRALDEAIGRLERQITKSEEAQMPGAEAQQERQA